MTDAQPRFDLDTPRPDDTAAALTGAGTPAAPTPRSGQGRPTRRKRASAPAHEIGADPGRILRAPSFLLLVGSGLTAVLWLAYLNPTTGVLAESRHWPWHLFRENFADGGAVVFAWDRARAIAVLGFLFALFYLLAAILRQSPRRGAATLVVGALGLATFFADAIDVWSLLGTVALALAAGAVFLRDGELAGVGRRGLATALGIVLAFLVFFPRLATLPGAPAQSRFLDLVQPFREALDGSLAWGFDRLWTPDGYLVIALFLLLVAGLLALFGVARRWTSNAARLMFVLAALAPVLGVFLLGMDDSHRGTRDVLSTLSEPTWVLALAITLTFLAVLLSALGLGGRLSRGLAEVGLLSAVFLMIAVVFRQGAREASVAATDWHVGLAHVARYLAAGFGAFALPTAAGVLDAGRPARSRGA